MMIVTEILNIRVKLQWNLFLSVIRLSDENEFTAGIFERLWEMIKELHNDTLITRLLNSRMAREKK
jgi:hypothetical protein